MLSISLPFFKPDSPGKKGRINPSGLLYLRNLPAAGVLISVCVVSSGTATGIIRKGGGSKMPISGDMP